MPHIIVEHSANISPEGRVAELLDRIAAVMREQKDNAGQPVYAIGAIRVRAHVAHDWLIADGEDDYAFMHITVKLGAGRSEAVEQATCQAVFEAAKAQLAPVFDHRYLALSLEFVRFSEAGTLKHNNIHGKFRR